MRDQSRHSVFLSLTLVFAAGLSGSNALADGVLIEKSTLEYLGIFYLPTVSELGFTYGGSAITLTRRPIHYLSWATSMSKRQLRSRFHRSVALQVSFSR